MFRSSFFPAILSFLLTPALAQAFTLSWPVDCTLGKDCFVQNYVDHDAGKAWRDYTCGAASYNGHDGTDIRLRNLQAMRDGVAVLAAADGTVLRVRDGMPDVSIRDAGESAIKNRECGNGIVIRHEGGYETMVCHLRQHSIRVKPGQQVKAGERLGLVGLSGSTEFPHAHLTLRKDGKVLDPFTGQSMEQACGAKNSKSLWAEPVAYSPPALLGDGFVDFVPKAEAMRDQPVHRRRAKPLAPVLAYWVDVMGPKAGDALALTVTKPDGTELATITKTLEKPKALFFQFVGARNRSELAPGTYRAAFTLKRGKTTLLESHREIVISTD